MEPLYVSQKYFKEVFSLKKKTLILSVSVLILVLMVSAAAAGEWRPPENLTEELNKIHGTITYEQLDGDVITFSVINHMYESVDKAVKDTYYHAEDAKRILKVNGVPIEQTKWAEYSGTCKGPKESQMEALEYQLNVWKRVLDGTEKMQKAVKEQMKAELLKIGAINEDGSLNLDFKPSEAFNDDGTFKVDTKKDNDNDATSDQTNGDITVIVNGKKVNFPDQKPYINNDDRTLVPVRFVSEALGAEVEWHGSQRLVKIIHSDKTIDLVIGEKRAKVNNQYKYFDTKATITPKDRTMVPLRFVSETLGARVNWEGFTRTVTITLEQ
jgi:hypothetical protein